MYTDIVFVNPFSIVQSMFIFLDCILYEIYIYMYSIASYNFSFCELSVHIYMFFPNLASGRSVGKFVHCCQLEFEDITSHKILPKHHSKSYIYIYADQEIEFLPNSN